MKSWFEIKNKATGVLDISLHDEIGVWGVSAADFISELKTHPDTKSINLSIHSPGGSALDGLAIYNALKASPAKVHAHVAGIAASAASIVLMAGDTISMPEDAFIMIHNPYTMAMGDSEEMRAIADTLDKIQASLSNIYEKRTGKDTEEISDMMSAETWLNSADALEHGFIDTISDAINVAAKIGVFNKYFKSMPIQNAHDIDGIKTLQDFENCLIQSCNCSKRLARSLSNRVPFLTDAEHSDEPDEDYSALIEAAARIENRLSR